MKIYSLYVHEYESSFELERYFLSRENAEAAVRELEAEEILRWKMSKIQEAQKAQDSIKAQNAQMVEHNFLVLSGLRQGPTKELHEWPEVPELEDIVLDSKVKRYLTRYEIEEFETED